MALDQLKIYFILEQGRRGKKITDFTLLHLYHCSSFDDYLSSKTLNERKR